MASQRKLDLGLGLLWTKVTLMKPTTQERPLPDLHQTISVTGMQMLLRLGI